MNFVDPGQIKSVFLGSDPQADLNADGVVDFIDLGVLKLAFFAAPGPAAVPDGCSAG